MNAHPASTRPSSGDYSGYAEWKAWDAGSFMAPTATERSYYARELRGHPLAGKHVLELGFGNGGFLAWAREQGAVVHGTELQPDLAARGAAVGIIVEPADFTAAISANCAKFALVAAFDVFEHVPIGDLRTLLATLAELLADGGLLVARFPNGQSPLSFVNQHGDVTHCTVLSADIMRQLIAPLPFEAVHLGNPAHPAGLIERVRHLVHRTLEIALQRLYGHDTPLAPNSVAILRRMPRADVAPNPAQPHITA